MKAKTIHTSRTIMSSELIELLDHKDAGQSYQEAMADNVFNKKTESSKKKSIGYLTRLYNFTSDSNFPLLEEYWAHVHHDEKPLLAFIYALSQDYLLKESVEYVKSIYHEGKAAIEGFEKNVDNKHPKRFSPKTLRSVSQNIASSWKQAGYIVGKVKNLRVKAKTTHTIVAFAYLIAYLEGLRGEFMHDHICVQALDLNQEEREDMLKQASLVGLLNYSKAGATTIITFDIDNKE